MDKFLIYVENGAICGTETTKLTGYFVPPAHYGFLCLFIGIIRIGACKS